MKTYQDLKETELYAELNTKRLTHDELFDDLRKMIDNL